MVRSGVGGLRTRHPRGQRTGHPVGVRQYGQARFDGGVRKVRLDRENDSSWGL
jgi:hypothetical protein